MCPEKDYCFTGRLFFQNNAQDRFDIAAASFTPEDKFLRCQVVSKKGKLAWHFVDSLSPETNNLKFLCSIVSFFLKKCVK